jgi:hypothetical protein
MEMTSRSINGSTDHIAIALPEYPLPIYSSSDSQNPPRYAEATDVIPCGPSSAAHCDAIQRGTSDELPGYMQAANSTTFARRFEWAGGDFSHGRFGASRVVRGAAQVGVFFLEATAALIVAPFMIAPSLPAGAVVLAATSTLQAPTGAALLRSAHAPAYTAQVKDIARQSAVGGAILGACLGLFCFCASPSDRSKSLTYSILLSLGATPFLAVFGAPLGGAVLHRSRGPDSATTSAAFEAGGVGLGVFVTLYLIIAGASAG